MANKKISDLTAQTTPASGDLVEIEEVAIAASKKSTLAQIFTAGKSAASTTATGVAELATVGEVTTGTSTTLVPSVAALKGLVHHFSAFISNPQGVYAQRAQIVFMKTWAAISIMDINIACSDYSPSAEMAGDLKWADDVNVGGFASAAVLHICDTTNGVFSITAHDLDVAAGKFIYFQLDASPHADILDFYLDFYYTVD